jgi:hypothetical protein
MSLRSAVVLTALLATLASGSLAAQQLAAPAALPEGPPASTTESAPVARPHPSPLFQRGESATASDSLTAAMGNSEGKNHTIVLSTLALVLIGVIILLLIA